MTLMASGACFFTLSSHRADDLGVAEEKDRRGSRPCELAGQSAGDDDDIGAFVVFGGIGALHVAIEALETGRLDRLPSAFPWGMPSTMSCRTTSPKFFSAIRCAVVAPTKPAPTTVIFLKIGK